MVWRSPPLSVTECVVAGPRGTFQSLSFYIRIKSFQSPHDSESDERENKEGEESGDSVRKWRALLLFLENSWLWWTVSVKEYKWGPNLFSKLSPRWVKDVEKDNTSDTQRLTESPKIGWCGSPACIRVLIPASRSNTNFIQMTWNLMIQARSQEFHPFC